MPVLVGLSVDCRGAAFNLADPEITIGRNEDNQITLNHASISGYHCTLTRQGDTFLLKDLDSTNGTRVNGQPIQQTLLQDKDLIHLGTVELVYAAQDAADLDLDALQSSLSTPPTVEVSTEPVETPSSFSSVSPFAPSSKRGRPTWIVLISIIGILALGCVALLFYILFAAD